MDLFKLLNSNEEKKELDKEDERDKERHRCKRPDRTWSNWLPGFLIYAGVIVRAQPYQALSLFQYLDLSYRAYVDFAGQAWLSYDEAFRMRCAIHPNLCRDEPLAGLWLARPNLGDRMDSGHLIRKAAVNVIPCLGTGQVVQPCLLCWEYNSRGV